MEVPFNPDNITLMDPKMPSEEVAQALDSLTKARLKLQGEKKGPYEKVVLRAAVSLERMVIALQTMRKDLTHVGL